MRRTIVLALVLVECLINSILYSQTRNYNFYLEKALTSSPLLQDLNSQKQLSLDEQDRLKKQYTRSRLEMNGNYLFVPIINRDKGRTSFQWDAQDATDYYGYDSSVTTGEFRAGFTWTKPLTGCASYRIAKQKGEIDRELLSQHIQMEQHELTRTVTEQYLLCHSDLVGLAETDSIDKILKTQRAIIEKLMRQALAKQTDINLIDIEISNNKQTASSFRQSYWTHLLDLNLLCGITDTTNVKLESIQLSEQKTDVESHFLKAFYFDSLSIKNDYKQFAVNYSPKLNLFIDGGLRTTSQFTNLTQHFGASTGISFSWLINDGGQKRNKYRQMQYLLNINEVYKTRKQVMILQKRNICLKQLAEQQSKITDIKNQLSDYENLLDKYMSEIKAGQISILDYITVLKGYVQQKKEYDNNLINREIIINALNYWNW